MSMYRPQRNYGCRIHDDLTYRGMKALVMENEKVRVSLLPGKGTEIYEFLYKPEDLDLMWLSANGVQNPNLYLPTSPDPVSSFIDYFPGGWQEVFPNGGVPSTLLGASYGQHGEVAHMPWEVEILEDSPERIRVRFRVRTKKLPCELRKTLTLDIGSAELKVEEELENLSNVELPFMWGHHIALGRPFLEPGCRIRLPDGVTVLTEEADSEVAAPGRVMRGREHAWPLAADGSGGTVDLSVLPEPETASEIVYLAGFHEGAWYEVENGRIGMGLRVRWDAETLPCLWYWQEYGGTKSYPWFGRHYNIGLEPFRGYPTGGVAKAMDNGSAGRIGPGETVTSWVTAEPYRLSGGE